MADTEARVDWRRVLFYAVVLALAIVVVWRSWDRRFEARHTAEVAAEPVPVPPAPVTDVSEWWSRMAVLHHRERMADLLDTDALPHSDVQLLIDQCGRLAEPGDTRDDAVRLIHTGSFGVESYTVELRPRGDQLIVTSHRIAMNPPPPDPRRVPADTGPTEVHEGLLRLTSPQVRKLDATAWPRVVAVVSEPAFARLAPGG
jgi:hypothetical protein